MQKVIERKIRDPNFAQNYIYTEIQFKKLKQC